MMLLHWVVGCEHLKTVYWSQLHELKCPVPCWTVGSHCPRRHWTFQPL